MRSSSSFDGVLMQNSCRQTAFARHEMADRIIQVIWRKIWPEHIAKIQLCIGALPEQEIAQTFITAGADEKIRIGRA